MIDIAICGIMELPTRYQAVFVFCTREPRIAQLNIDLRAKGAYEVKPLTLVGSDSISYAPFALR